MTKILQNRHDSAPLNFCIASSNYSILSFPGDREFIFLDEQLTKLILELDKVQTDGLEEIRAARKSAVQRIQFLINNLESKV